MDQDIISLVSVLMFLAVVCQWIAWRFRLPALVLLSICGVLIGPVFGLISPSEIFGDKLTPLVSLAVAIILFEGGLNLHLAELHSTKKATIMMIMIGAPLGWVLIGLGLYYIAGFSMPVSALLGGLLVVTGPTVIMPMLRQARLNPRVSSVLKWEGIINDPIGALFATITFEYFSSNVIREHPLHAASVLAFHVILISLQSFLIGHAIAYIFRKSYVSEFLKPLVMLTAVLVAYVLGNRMQDEGGLIAVTVLGMTLANVPFPSFEEQRRFKEYLTILLVSLVFIILTASLNPETLLNIPMPMILFVAALLFVIRPLTVWISLIGSELSTKERLFIGWIGPRGAVCVAITGLFAPKMVKLGYVDAQLLVPLVFVIVFATVILHGFTIRPLARWFGLVPEGKQGVVIVGATSFTNSFSEILKKQDIPVLVVDSHWYRLSAFKQAQIPTLYGEPLSENFVHQIDASRYTYLLCATDNSAYNSLVCSHFSHEYGRGNIMQLAGEKEESDLWSYNDSLKGLSLVDETRSFSDFENRLSLGWKFVATRLTDKFTYQDFIKNLNNDFLALLTVSETGVLRFKTSEKHLKPKVGDTLITLVAPITTIEMPTDEVFDQVERQAS